MKKIFNVFLTLLCLFVIFNMISFFKALNKSEKKLTHLDHREVKLSYGKVTYLDHGNSENILLSVHGLYGGYDQAFNNLKDFSDTYRIIAPSRFGYLGSDIKGNGSPEEQVSSFIELLNHLNIDKVFVVGTSAGGTVAIKFVLDHPERCRGLILYSSASPWDKKPNHVPKRLGPPEFLNNNIAMWLISPFFDQTMGMKPSTIYQMFPIDKRAKGVNIDSDITNRDMAVNFNDYRIEDLKVPTLIIHSEDDKVAPYSAPQGHVKQSLYRYPRLTKKIFKNGGHLMEGHGAEIKKTVKKFVEEN
ncbi:TPA: alpha/beta fold hydrolase [Streptococcus suis]